ncbi:MAG: NfeD family protein [Ideonella sp.]|nr:NfeD family protein [Ideonella sp.]MCC7459373.1 NfeD family protein [Nitrospira sp.]
MQWAASTLWWLAAGVLVAVELASGTFYLLMLAFGAAAGALAAHLGAGANTQMVIAALVGGGATALWHFKRFRAPRSAPAEANPDVNLDIGQTVRVDAWAADGTAQVNYRGASWAVSFRGTGAPAPGEHTIVAVQGSRLMVAPRSAP